MIKIKSFQVYNDKFKPEYEVIFTTYKIFQLNNVSHPVQPWNTRF